MDALLQEAAEQEVDEAEVRRLEENVRGNEPKRKSKSEKSQSVTDVAVLS